MKILIAFEFLLVLVCGENIFDHPNWPKTQEICGISYSDRIIGGTRVSLGAYPWIAHLGIADDDTKTGKKSIKYVCGGSLIHPRFVVSAAHCVTDFPGDFQWMSSWLSVKLGEHDLTTLRDCETDDHCADPPQILYPKNIVIPNEYNNVTLENDIALIELNDNVNFTHWVSPVCLPEQHVAAKNLVGQMVEVAGWGLIDVDFVESARVLQSVKLPVVDKHLCHEIPQMKEMNFTQGQICVGGKEGKDSCNGDSGGPMVKLMASKANEPHYFLLGLVSVGVPSCGKFDTPAIYTNVTHYLPWILDNLKD